jgi:hypothetical protein
MSAMKIFRQLRAWPIRKKCCQVRSRGKISKPLEATMSICPKKLLTAAILLVTASAIAQERWQPPDPNLLARFSYYNSGVVMRQGDVHHVCVAVSRNGDYRIVRSLDNGQTQSVHGKMPKEELRQLTNLLEAAELRKLSGYHGGLIRQESESFAAEIPLRDGWHEDGDGNWIEHETWHLQWLNPDGGNPFPASVSKIVDWLIRFQPKDGKSFDYADYPDVCPTGGLRLLQPAIAENSHP